MAPRSPSFLIRSMNAIDSAVTSPPAVIVVNTFAVVGDASNVPGLSDLSKQIQALQQRLKYSKTCRQECTKLANRCGNWAEDYRGYRKSMDGTEAQKIANECISHSEDQILKLTKISSRSRWWLLWHTEHVKHKLSQVESDMDALFETFQERSIHRANEELEDHRAQAWHVNELEAEVKELEAALRIQNKIPAQEKSEEEQMWKRHEETRNAEAATPQTLEGTSVADNSYNVTWNDISQAVTELESRTGVRPVVPHLGGDVKVRRDRKGHPTPANGSHHADILIGLYLDRKVAIKDYRFVGGKFEEMRERFLTEIKIWSQLNHPHIHPFIGVTDKPVTNTVIVSEWEANGNAFDYVNKQPGELRVRIDLLIGAAEGLIYIHERDIVHGNLKGRNILVSDKGEALITGFQRARMLSDTAEDTALSSDREVDQNWTAPDIARSGETTFKSDVWSFGMVMFELIAGKVPYDDMTRGDTRWLKFIVDKTLPTKPRHALVTNEVWELMKYCWTWEPEERPEMREVLARLRAL